MQVGGDPAVRLSVVVISVISTIVMLLFMISTVAVSGIFVSRIVATRVRRRRSVVVFNDVPMNREEERARVKLGLVSVGEVAVLSCGPGWVGASHHLRPF